MISAKIRFLVDTTRKLLTRGASRNLRKVLKKARPEDIAQVMRYLDKSKRLELFNLLPDVKISAEVVSELDAPIIAEILPELGVDRVVGILHQLSGDDVADIVEELPHDFQEALLARMKSEDVEEVEDLMKYKPDTAGGIMSPDVFALPQDITVAQAIAKVQEARDAETVFYIYVVNEYGDLIGVMSLKKLLLSHPDTHLSEIMEKDPIRVKVDEDQEEVVRIVSRYNFLSVPVVDEANKLVGVITVDDVIDVMRDEATEDILLMTGAEKDALEQKSIFRSFRSRMPWLLITLVGEGVLAAEVVMRFHDTLVRAMFLAGFIPVIIAMGGNVGLQTMAIVVRGLSMGKIYFSNVLNLLIKELGLAFLLGATYGVFMAAFAYFRYGSFGLAPVSVGIAVIASMVMATSVGTLVPIMFEKLGIDPAVATGPFVTVTIDVLGVLAYLGIATLFLSFTT